jgi:serine/threonine protein kinase
MYVSYLLKTGGARMHNVDTYKVSCLANDILGIESIKSATELGQDANEFTHLIKSILQAPKQTVIVKIHDSRSLFIKNELECLQRLNGFRNVVKHICNFTCQDDKKRWMALALNTKTTLCNIKGNDSLHMLVMEYIENGTIDKLFALNLNLKQIKSFFLQIALAIMEMGANYKVYHGDLNSGNILFVNTLQKHITYNVFDKIYKIKSYGRYPVFIDFGRGGLYDAKAKNKYLILDDVMIGLSVLVNWITDAEIKIHLQQVVYDLSSVKRDFEKVIIAFKN